jgi:hypothetical protein
MKELSPQKLWLVLGESASDAIYAFRTIPILIKI